MSVYQQIQNNCYLLWLISLLCLTLGAQAAPETKSSTGLAKDIRRIDQLIAAGKGPSAYFLGDSLLRHSTWEKAADKLSFYQKHLQSILQAHQSNPGLKSYLMEREYPRLEELFDLLSMNQEVQYTSVAINYLNLLRSLYEDKRQNSQLTILNERYEAIFQRYTLALATDSLLAQQLYQEFEAIGQRIEEQRILATQPQAVDIELVNLDQLQRLIPAEEAWIAYFSGSKYTYAIVLGKTDQRVIKLGKTRFIESTVRSYLSSIYPRKRRETFFKTSTTLHQYLFAPLLPYLDDIDRIAIVPDQAIGWVSFDALISQLPPNWDWNPKNYSALPFLIDRFQFRYQLSIADLMTEEQDKLNKKADILLDPELLIFAPVFDRRMKARLAEGDVFGREIPSLSFSNQLFEETIQPLFDTKLRVKEAANATQFFADIGEAEIVQLFTHAFIDENQMDSSFILLAPDLYQADRLRKLRFGLLADSLKDLSTDLIILGSCQSGRGKVLNGEGLSGLARIFNLHGIPNSIYSIWSVDEKATAELFARFYFHIRQGLSKDRALHEAKQHLRRQAAYGAPFYWAGFIYWGNASAYQFSRPMTSPPTLGFPVWGVLLVLIGGLLGFFWWFFKSRGT